MSSSPSRGSSSTNDIIVEITETLSACGIDEDEYRLYDAVDVEALEQLLTSSNGDVEVRFEVEGVPLQVTPEGVDILIGERSSLTNQ
jgi:hypothetical protein